MGLPGGLLNEAMASRLWRGSDPPNVKVPEPCSQLRKRTGLPGLVGDEDGSKDRGSMGELPPAPDSRSSLDSESMSARRGQQEEAAVSILFFSGATLAARRSKARCVAFIAGLCAIWNAMSSRISASHRWPPWRRYTQRSEANQVDTAKRPNDVMAVSTEVIMEVISACAKKF